MGFGVLVGYVGVSKWVGVDDTDKERGAEISADAPSVSG